MKKIKDYTLEDVLEIVKKCDSKTDFHKKHYRIYRFSKKMGWLTKIDEVLPRKRKWSIDDLKVEAQKYKTRIDFMKNNISAYNIALKSGYYDEIVSHMGEKNTFKPKTVWTYDLVKKHYESCGSLKEVREKYGNGVVSCAMRNKWHDDLSKHFNKERGRSEIWTFDKVREEALKYESRKDFCTQCPSAYQKALEMKWMDQISSHMNKGYTKWTKEKIMEIIDGCINMGDLKKKSPALYIYIKRHELEKQYF